MRDSKTILCLVVAFISACAVTTDADFSQEMFNRSSALTKLSAAMEAFVRYGNPPAKATDAELLAEGTKHDPALLTNLGEYKLRVLNRNRHAVVLVCAKEGDRALLEDAGCTAKLDEHHWKSGKVPCEFTVQVDSVCGPN